MGRRIMKITKQRDEDFLKMDSLTYLADQHNMAVLSFEQERITNRWCVCYFDRSRWLEPQRAFLPTDFIYEKQMEDYIRRCTVRSPSYGRFQDMVLGEIERLKQIPL